MRSKKFKRLSGSIKSTGHPPDKTGPDWTRENKKGFFETRGPKFIRQTKNLWEAKISEKFFSGIEQNEKLKLKPEE